VKLSGARATVVGLGASGLAAARLLVARGAHVTVNDARDAAALGAKADEAKALGAGLELGGHDAERLAHNDLIVVSPGVPALPELEAAERRGVKVVSEVELASWFVEGTVIGITGTNGKSTVTTLVGEMCKAGGRPTFVGGNLGTPLVDVVGSPAAAADGMLVVELSSFQLERVERFHADVGVLLNVTDDHLDRYPSFAAYAAAKARLFTNQTRRDFALVPSDDELCKGLARASAAQLALFAGTAGQVRREGDFVVDTGSGLRLAVAEIGIKGDHNIDNACAAALAARLAGVERGHIERVLREFRGLGHRMQYAGAIGPVSFYDDSKATNVGAAVAAVLGLGRQGVRVVLIAGGKDKGGSYLPLREIMERHGRALVTLGEAAPLIETEFRETGLPLRPAANMREAVRLAHQAAQPGDAVLLAPACASFDMFRSYAHRGDVFCEEVAGLQKELAP
jgi:UDP-N-acetylmuramoylalanine--D-glutamate ligase